MKEISKINVILKSKKTKAIVAVSLTISVFLFNYFFGTDIDSDSINSLFCEQ